MKRQLVKVQENQSNVEKKVDILIQMLHSKTDASKKGSQKINVPAQIAVSNYSLCMKEGIAYIYIYIQSLFLCSAT